MKTKRTRWLGLALCTALATASGLLALPAAQGLPAGAPKIGMVCTVPTTANTFNLVAKSGTIETPDGNTVFMWSYANADAPDNGAFQYPGPVLCVNEGAMVTVNLTNNLPEASSIVFPGQDAEVSATGGSAGLLTTEAAASGGGVTYSFTAGTPGTYLYESGSDVAKQIEMGLYGALIVRPNSTTCPAVADTDCAYGPSTRFNATREYLLLLAEIDPDLHHVVETGGTDYDFTTKHNRYFTVNGRSFPDTLQDNGSVLLPNQPYGALVRIQPNTPGSPPALVRMINAGADNHPFHPHGNHLTQVAQDGRTVAPTEHFGETIGSGQTEDFLLRWDNQTTDTAGQPFNDDWNPATNPLPVPQPNYRNLTFKDANTYYGGSPYLGYKGTLPTGTVSQNVCGEWYFPWHSHALNEFTNFDEGFGGMATLLRVDPLGGCAAVPSSSNILAGTLRNSLTQTTLSTGINATQTSILVASNTGFTSSLPYYIRIDSEILQVTAKGPPGSRTWTVVRHQLGTTASSHAAGATVTAGITSNSFANLGEADSTYFMVNSTLTGATRSTDWYAGFTGVPPGSQNFRVSYQGTNCGPSPSRLDECPTTTSLNIPQQTLSICNWTNVNGASGCSGTSGSAATGWVTLPAPQALSVPRTTTLSAAVTTTQGTLTVASGSGSPTSGPFYIRVDSEVMQVTGVSGTTWIVLRHQLGTTAATHSSGATVFSEVLTTWTLPGNPSNYIGTASNKGQVRVLVHTQRGGSTSFTTWGNLLKLNYDAP